MHLDSNDPRLRVGVKGATFLGLHQRTVIDLYILGWTESNLRGIVLTILVIRRVLWLFFCQQMLVLHCPHLTALSNGYFEFDSRFPYLVSQMITLYVDGENLTMEFWANYIGGPGFDDVLDPVGVREALIMYHQWGTCPKTIVELHS